ncbi:MAG: GPW/gp25 family protein [Chromatiales bacterium]|jgi:phage baseplate assembly protein W
MAVHYFDYPFHFDGRGRSASTDIDDHVRDLIRQVLFTSPGERVNRPDFGCGLKRLLFLPNSDALAAATQVTVQAALQRWLERVIQVEKVEVEADEARLTVTLVYRRLDSGERITDRFSETADFVS